MARIFPPIFLALAVLLAAACAGDTDPAAADVAALKAQLGDVQTRLIAAEGERDAQKSAADTATTALKTKDAAAADATAKLTTATSEVAKLTAAVGTHTATIAELEIKVKAAAEDASSQTASLEAIQQKTATLAAEFEAYKTASTQREIALEAKATEAINKANTSATELASAVANLGKVEASVSEMRTQSEQSSSLTAQQGGEITRLTTATEELNAKLARAGEEATQLQKSEEAVKALLATEKATSGDLVSKVASLQKEKTTAEESVQATKQRASASDAKLSDLDKKYHETLQKLLGAETQRDSVTDQLKKAAKSSDRCDSALKSADDRLEALQTKLASSEKDFATLCQVIMAFARNKLNLGADLFGDVIEGSKGVFSRVSDWSCEKITDLRAWATESGLRVSQMSTVAAEELSKNEHGKNAVEFFQTKVQPAVMDAVMIASVFIEETAEKLERSLLVHLPHHPRFDAHRDQVAKYLSLSLLAVVFGITPLYVLYAFLKLCFGGRAKEAPVQSKIIKKDRSTTRIKTEKNVRGPNSRK